jgi:hypothetical protein
MVALIVCLGVILFVVTWIVIGANSNPFPAPPVLPSWEFDNYKVSHPETRITMLEMENKRLNYIIENFNRDKRCFEEQYHAHCVWCGQNFYSKFYAKTPDEQKVADLLKSISSSSEEIAKKLDIKITK